MKNLFIQGLEEALKEGPNIKTKYNGAKGCTADKWWDNQFFLECERQITLYRNGQGRLQHIGE